MAQVTLRWFVMPRRNTKKSTGEFIREARAVHGNRYGYEQCVYQSAHVKLTVVCRIHGAFQISANSHLQGSGCGRCNGGGKLTQKQYISRARAVHGRRYRYNRLHGLRRSIQITCEHGTTQVMASSHLNGTGCPACRNSGSVKELYSPGHASSWRSLRLLANYL